MRKRLIKALVRGDLDLRLLYDYFIEKGGERSLDVHTFAHLFSMNVPKNVPIQSVYKNLISEYKVNILFDRDKNIIKCI